MTIIVPTQEKVRITEQVLSWTKIKILVHKDLSAKIK